MVNDPLLIHLFKDDKCVKWVRDSSPGQIFEIVQGKGPHLKSCEKQL